MKVALFWWLVKVSIYPQVDIDHILGWTMAIRWRVVPDLYFLPPNRIHVLKVCINTHTHKHICALVFPSGRVHMYSSCIFCDAFEDSVNTHTHTKKMVDWNIASLLTNTLAPPTQITSNIYMHYTERIPHCIHTNTGDTIYVYLHTLIVITILRIVTVCVLWLSL